MNAFFTLDRAMYCCDCEAVFELCPGLACPRCGCRVLMSLSKWLNRLEHALERTQ